MKLWRERLTDEEYIARIRKQLKIGPWIRALYLILAAVVALLFVKIVQVVVDGIINFAPVGQQNNILAVFASAAAIGALMGLFLTQVMHYLAQSLVQYRTERLLIECWDRLQLFENGEPSLVASVDTGVETTRLAAD